MIPHPSLNPGTFVAEHAMESLSLLHAVLAVTAINQSPLSVEVRAESLLYFEASVDLHVRSLQQQDDISLFTLLMLSLYYAFDSGTSQSQHFSRRAQDIINGRLEMMGTNYLDAGPDFKFLVRCHVWYEVLANLSRMPGDLRDLECGRYDLATLIGIIEQWDQLEEKDAGLSGINPNYSMTGLNGVPTFFISLLNDITMLKEEQSALYSVRADTLDEAGQAARQALISKHKRKIRDLVSFGELVASGSVQWLMRDGSSLQECKIQFARPGRLVLPPTVAGEVQLHRAVSVRFFDLFRLAASIHLLTELQGMPSNDVAIQQRVSEMASLLSNIEQSESVGDSEPSTVNDPNCFAFFALPRLKLQFFGDVGVLHRRCCGDQPPGQKHTASPPRQHLEQPLWKRMESSQRSGRVLAAECRSGPGRGASPELERDRTLPWMDTSSDVEGRNPVLRSCLLAGQWFL